MFKSNVFRSFVNTLNTGSLIQHMFTSQLTEFAFPLPPLEEQEAISSKIDEHFSLIGNLEDTIVNSYQHSDSLRQSLLKKAFSGRLVPQDPNDEPASVLLERIRVEREAAGKKGKRGKPKAKGSKTVEQPKLLGD